MQAGETLYSISRRHGVSVDDLMRANGLAAGAVIRPGQKLSLPRKGAATPAATKTATVKATPASGAGRSGGGDAAGRPPAGPAYGRHTVLRGETVNRLAERFGVSNSEFMRLNGLKDPTKLRAGAVVKYPLGAADQAAGQVAATAATAAGFAEDRLPAGWQWHVVERGESLSRIAARHGHDRASLERANELTPGASIHEGLRLKVPPPGVTLAEPRHDPGRRAPRDGDHSVLAYTVRKGDTLEGLAEVFLTTPAILRKLNRLPTGDTLAAGQRIVVPNNLFE